MARIRRRHWPKGTWMHLASTTLLNGLLERRNMSHRQLAQLVGCHPSTIDYLCNGRLRNLTPARATLIAEALSVKLDDLFEVRLSPGKDRNGTERAA